MQHIACSTEQHRDGSLYPLAVYQFALREGLEVFGLDNFLACNLCDGVSPIVRHHLLDFICTCLARANHVDRGLTLEAVLLIYIEQVVIEGHAMVFGIGCNLANQTDSRWRALVTHCIIGEVAETLLAATNVFACAFPFAYAGGNPLEARVFVGQRNALAVSNLAYQLAGYNGLDEIMLGTQFAEFLHVGDDVVGVHHASLVAVDDSPLTLVVAADDSNTVGIGVACYHKVGVQFGAEVHAHSHCLCVLGIRADDGGEVAVNHHLLGHYVYVLKAPRTQAHRYNLATCSV